METGQEYIPLPGAVPAWLFKRPGISQGAKICYAWLSQFAGCPMPTVAEIAEGVGVKPRQAANYLVVLRAASLIARDGPDLVFLAPLWAAEGCNIVQLGVQHSAAPPCNIVQAGRQHIAAGAQDTAASGTVPPLSAPLTHLQERLPEIAGAQAGAHEGSLRGGFLGTLDLSKALFGYWGRPATKDEADEAVEFLQEYGLQGVSVTQEHLETAAAAGKQWWREKHGTTPRKLKPFLIALGEAVKTPAGAAPDPYAEFDAVIKKQVGFSLDQLSRHELADLRVWAARQLHKPLPAAGAGAGAGAN